jgi:hypothetical protein
MRPLYGYIISILLLLTSFMVKAQETPEAQNADSVAQAARADSIAIVNQKADSLDQANKIADSVAITGSKFSVNIFIDYGKLLTLPFDFEQKFEGGFYLIFNRKWTIGAEGGKMNLTPHRPYRNGDAEVSGIYYGGFLQYFLNIDLYSSLFAGIGYNAGSFDDYITYTIGDDFFRERTYEQRRSGLKAAWATIRLGTEQKLNKTIALGGVIEFRIKTSFDQPEGIEPYAIPGYGKANDRTSPALNLYLKLSL